MYFQFLIEDKSSEILIDILMKKIIKNCDDVSYRTKSFKGIGGFTSKNIVKDTKKGTLLTDLATYLRAFNQSLSGIKSAVFVILDNDERDTVEFRRCLEEVSELNNITVDHVYCIAVEEIEAWLLGDKEAILKAYPNAKINELNKYEQDSICGTWEKLADVVYPGGIVKMKKEKPTYRDKGLVKAEWSEKIGMHMDIHNNCSDSFNHFVAEVQKRIG